MVALRYVGARETSADDNTGRFTNELSIMPQPHRANYVQVGRCPWATRWSAGISVHVVRDPHTHVQYITHCSGQCDLLKGVLRVELFTLFKGYAM